MRRGIVAFLGVVVLVILVASYASSRGSQPDIAVIDDILAGKTIGGSLHSDAGQIACFDAADAARGAYRAGESPADEEVRQQLIRSLRCIATPSEATFSMTADGQEHFATAHGSVDLWASR